MTTCSFRVSLLFNLSIKLLSELMILSSALMNSRFAVDFGLREREKFWFSIFDLRCSHLWSYWVEWELVLIIRLCSITCWSIWYIICFCRSLSPELALYSNWFLEKEKSKDHSWKEIALKLIQRLQLDSEEKHHVNQNAFIAKNVQKLKTSVQLLNKQLHTQKNTRFSTKITSWANVTREEITTRKQRFRSDSLSLCKKWKVMIKIMNRREIKEIQKKSIEQILQRIADVSTDQRNLIMSLRKLSSDDIFLHAVSSDAWANLKKTQMWAKEITSLTYVARRTFAMLTYKVCTTINMSNQEKIIKRLIKDNVRLYEDLKVLRIVWLKKIADSEKTHSSLIVEIMIKAMMNQLMNVSMLNLYQECACKLFEKNCCITQCFRCHKFDHMIKICKKNQCCEKCADKHHIKKCVMSLNKRRCINCNENHELWRCICLKWW